jgi:hypothetical protein
MITADAQIRNPSEGRYRFLELGGVFMASKADVFPDQHLCRPHGKAVPAGSRGLSAATPPETIRHHVCTLKGCQNAKTS